MRLLAALALGLSLAAPSWAAECGADLKAPSRQIARSGKLELAFAPSRWPIPVGQHFELLVQVCSQPGEAQPAGLKVDANMPMHRHGMNYRTTVKHLGNGRYRVEGLMFHMPGHWQFVFDLGEGAMAKRLTSELDVQ